MGIGTSILLIAVGAILRFAVSVTTHGFNIHTIGLILMVVGIVGLVISLFMMVVWTDRRRNVATVPARDPVEARDPYAP
jgi:heme/copper-type cytochrome/quinol oxidase subunit 2